jgi:hypothetical protein
MLRKANASATSCHQKNSASSEAIRLTTKSLEGTYEADCTDREA